MPVTFELGLSYLMQTINIAFIGSKNNTDMLAGITIGSLYFHLTSMSLIVGFNFLISTVGSQAYGHGDMRLVGHTLNKGRICITIALVPMLFLMFFCNRILSGLGVEEQIANYSA